MVTCVLMARCVDASLEDKVAALEETTAALRAELEMLRAQRSMPTVLEEQRRKLTTSGTEEQAALLRLGDHAIWSAAGVESPLMISPQRTSFVEVRGGMRVDGSLSASTARIGELQLGDSGGEGTPVLDTSGAADMSIGANKTIGVTVKPTGDAEVTGNLVSSASRFVVRAFDLANSIAENTCEDVMHVHM